MMLLRALEIAQRCSGSWYPFCLDQEKWVMGKRCIPILLVVALLTANILMGCTGSSEHTAKRNAEQGMKLLDQGHYDEAIEEYNEVILLKPDYADAYNNRGYAYSHLGQFEQAIDDYDEAISLDREFANAYYNRGVAYYFLGQYERAIEDLHEAIQLDSEFDRAYFFRGGAYGEQGKNAEAIADFEKFIILTDNTDWIKTARHWIEEYHS